MLGAERAVELGLEPAIEMAAVEEPGERIGLREALHRLTLLLLEEARPDVARKELEREEVILAERAPVERIGDVEHAA